MLSPHAKAQGHIQIRKRQSVLPHSFMTLILVFAISLSFNSGMVVQAQDNGTLKTAAAEINTELFGGRYCQVKKDPGTVVVGIWPFDEEKVPVSPSSARRLYTDLLHQLVDMKPSCVDYLDGDGFSNLVENINRTGGFESGQPSLGELLTKVRQTLHYIITPQIRQQGKHPYLSLKAIERSTLKTLAQTSWIRIPKSYLASSLADTAIGLDASIEKASRYLVSYAYGMVELRPHAIRYEASSARTELSKYMLDRLTTAIVQEYANLASGKTLQVRKYKNLFDRSRGVKVESRDLDALADKEDNKYGSGSYELTGNYWVLEDAIELKLSLRNNKNDTISWTGRIRKDGLPNKAMKPKNLSLPKHEVIQADPDFIITSPRADNPAYHPGEELTVLIRLGHPSWLYCFFISAKGEVTQLLPNRFQKDSSQGRYFEAGVLHALPNPELDPFIYRITAQTRGEEIFRCFASNRNITSELPQELRGTSFDPIPNRLATRLSQVFRRIPNAKIHDASLTVTVD